MKQFMLTTKARNYLQQFRADSGHDASNYVRITVIGGGCSGLSYKLGFDDCKAADDVEETFGDIRIVINKKSLLYVVGTELDYTDGLNGKGFVFNNPNATRTCGCGESFAV